MAIDGAKIIDGGTAHDTYWVIMNLYGSDVSVAMILDEFPLVQHDFY